MADTDRNIVEEEDILYSNKTGILPELEKESVIVGIKAFASEEEFYRTSDPGKAYQPGRYVEFAYENGGKLVYEMSGSDEDKAHVLENGLPVETSMTVGQMQGIIDGLKNKDSSEPERNYNANVELNSIDNEKPPRHVKLKDGFPDYENLDGDYSLENVQARFKVETGQDLDAALSKYTDGTLDNLRDYMSLYAKLYALKDRADKDDKVPTQSKIDIAPNKELCLVTKFPETEEYSAFGIVIRDGKVTFSGVDLSKEQLREAYHFLYNRGISNIEIPDNMHEELKKNLNEAAKELIDDMSPPVNASEAQVDAFMEENTSQAVSVSSIKSGFSYQKDIKDDMNAWGRKKCGIPGLTYFHYRTGGWDCWATYSDVNPENPLQDTKIDKNGNIKARFKHKMYTRMHRGKLEIAYALAPGEKMSGDFAEQLAVLAGKAGLDALDFRQTQIDERDSMELKLGLAKEGIVPIGVSLKPKHLNEMIGKYTEEKGVLKSLEYQRKLMIRLKEQEIDKGKWEPGKGEDNSFNRKYYEDTMIRMDLAPFRNVYNQVFRPRLELLEHENVHAKDAYAKANMVHDIYFAVQDAVKYRGSSLHAMLGIMEETVNANPMQDTLDNVPNKKDLDLLHKIKDVIKEFKKENPELMSKPNAKVTDLSADHYDKLYKALLKPYEEFAQKEMDQSYLDNRGPSVTHESIARNFLGSATERLSAMHGKFEGHFNPPDLQQMKDYDLTIPNYKKLSKSKFEPSPGIEEKREAEIGKTMKKRNAFGKAAAGHDDD